jgi:hypothetical protein
MKDLDKLKLHDLSQAEIAKNESNLIIEGDTESSCNCGACFCSCVCSSCSCSCSTTTTTTTQESTTTTQDPETMGESTFTNVYNERDVSVTTSLNNSDSTYSNTHSSTRNPVQTLTSSINTK